MVLPCKDIQGFFRGSIHSLQGCCEASIGGLSSRASAGFRALGDLGFGGGLCTGSWLLLLVENDHDIRYQYSVRAKLQIETNSETVEMETSAMTVMESGVRY